MFEGIAGWLFEHWFQVSTLALLALILRDVGRVLSVIGHDLLVLERKLNDLDDKLSTVLGSTNSIEAKVRDVAADTSHIRWTSDGT